MKCTLLWTIAGYRPQCEVSSKVSQNIVLDYDALTKEDFVLLIGILKKPKYMKNPISQRGKVRPQTPHGKGKWKRK